ncbi:CPCC family cysteine-rich protein [Streptomyces sp. NPDC094472]|uniref:CPCC family cysteine-rich protein n=1 Tax=unclassified Streptomyces TaxID=2593676 RepID=UPI00331DB95C
MPAADPDLRRSSIHCSDQPFLRWHALWLFTYEICPVCFWEDDAIQFRWPTVDGGGPELRKCGRLPAPSQHGRPRSCSQGWAARKASAWSAGMLDSRATRARSRRVRTR